MPTQADDIHKILRDFIVAYDFPVVTYPAGVRTTSEGMTPTTLKAATVLIKPLSATFNLPKVNRRSGFRERDAWLWEAIVEFSREVSIEAFEDDITNSLLRIPRTETKPQVDLILDEANYRQPPEQQPAGGLRVVFRFRAELSPL